MALPAVVDRQAEFDAGSVGVERIAGFADDGLDAVDQHGRDHAEAVGFADMDEILEQRRRQFAGRAEEAVVAGAGRERAEIVLQRLGVARLDEAHGHRLAAAATRSTSEYCRRSSKRSVVIGTLPSDLKRNRRRPSGEATPAWLRI